MGNAQSYRPEFTLYPPFFDRVKDISVGEIPDQGVHAKHVLHNHFPTEGVRGDLHISPDTNMYCLASLDTEKRGGTFSTRYDGDSFTISGTLSEHEPSSVVIGRTPVGNPLVPFVIAGRSHFGAGLHAQYQNVGLDARVMERSKAGKPNTAELKVSRFGVSASAKADFGAVVPGGVKVTEFGVCVTKYSGESFLFGHQSTSSAAARTKPLLEIGGRVVGDTAIASLYHNMVITRGVKNPFEEWNVKKITNYLDFGVELSTDLSKGEHSPMDVALGIGWQINKGLQVKARLTEKDFVTAIGLKSWSQPGVTLTLGHRVEMATGKQSTGVSLLLDNFGGIQYKEPTADYEASKATTIRKATRPTPQRTLR